MFFVAEYEYLWVCIAIIQFISYYIESNLHMFVFCYIIVAFGSLNPIFCNVILCSIYKELKVYQRYRLSSESSQRLDLLTSFNTKIVFKFYFSSFFRSQIVLLTKIPFLSLFQLLTFQKFSFHQLVRR